MDDIFYGGPNNFSRNSLELFTVQCNIGYSDFERLFPHCHLPFLGRFLPRLWAAIIGGSFFCLKHAAFEGAL